MDDAPHMHPGVLHFSGKRRGTRHGMPVGEVLRGDACEEAIEIGLCVWWGEGC